MLIKINSDLNRIFFIEESLFTKINNTFLLFSQLYYVKLEALPTFGIIHLLNKILLKRSSKQDIVKKKKIHRQSFNL